MAKRVLWDNGSGERVDLTPSKPRLFISPELENFFGPLKPEIKQRLSNVYHNPRRYWDDAHGIILTMEGIGLTLWQAVMRVDPTFPNTGPVTTFDQATRKSTRVEDWRRYPTPELIRAALLYAAPVKIKHHG